MENLLKLLEIIIWPAILITFLVVYNKEMRQLIHSAAKLKIGDFEVEIAQRIENRSSSKSNKNEEEDVDMDDYLFAKQVAKRASKYNLLQIKEKLEDYAEEYEEIREKQEYGKGRLIHMNRVVFKMRTLAIVGWPLLTYFAKYHSPGYKLVAVSFLQISPLFEWAEWLGDVASEDMTYVGHQATIAILKLSRTCSTKDQRQLIRNQVTRIKKALAKETKPHFRGKMIPAIEKAAKS